MRAGLRKLPVEPYPFAGGNVSLTTTEHITAIKSDAIQTLVDAMFLANDVFRTDPASVVRIIRDEAADLLKEHFAVEAGFAEWLYPLLRDEIAETPVPAAAGIHNALRIRFSTNPELKEFNPMLMWDLSFARKSMAKREQAETLG